MKNIFKYLALILLGLAFTNGLFNVKSLNEATKTRRLRIQINNPCGVNWKNCSIIDQKGTVIYSKPIINLKSDLDVSKNGHLDVYIKLDGEVPGRGMYGAHTNALSQYYPVHAGTTPATWLCTIEKGDGLSYDITNIEFKNE